jgi:hypothetical protein
VQNEQQGEELDSNFEMILSTEDEFSTIEFITDEVLIVIRWQVSAKSSLISPLMQGILPYSRLKLNLTSTLESWLLTKSLILGKSFT